MTIVQKHRIGTLLFSILFMIGFSHVAAQNGPVFRVGILDEQLGEISNGARLAVEELNSSGGARGADGTYFRLELIIQPLGNEDSQAENILNLREASIIAVLGPVSDSVVKQNLTALQSLNVPILLPVIGDTTFTNDKSGRFVRVRAAQVHQGRALADYLIQDVGLQQIATVQLDNELETSAAVVGFTIALSNRSINPQLALQAQTESTLQNAIQQIVAGNPEIVVAYGATEPGLDLIIGLRESGYSGLIAYNQLETLEKGEGLAFEELNGVISTTTWAYTADDDASDAFRDRFIRLYGKIPGAIEAASYDAVLLLANAINRPGELQANITQGGAIEGVQGTLNSANFGGGETGDNVSIIQNGPFGAPVILARYAGGVQLNIDAPALPTATPTVAPTATPDGVVITIKQARQNVRSGPSTSYDVVGQMSQNEQARVIGATIDLSWVVISYRGTQGWLATYLLDVFGDLSTVPIITPPPTPTPPPTATPLPEADIIITAASSAPSPIIVNLPFTVNVTVQNIGALATGSFAVASTFPPNNIYSSAIVSPLAPGQATVVTLSGTFTNTGCYAVVLVADLNNEVGEGISGENNNLFNFNYCINKPILRQGSQTMNPGDTIDLEGNALQGDANWNLNGNQLDALFTARLGIIPGVTLETVHWDLINPSIINQTTILRSSLAPGTVIGVLTADGNRAAIRVDGLPGAQIQLTYVTYQN